MELTRRDEGGGARSDGREANASAHAKFDERNAGDRQEEEAAGKHAEREEEGEVETDGLLPLPGKSSQPDGGGDGGGGHLTHQPNHALIHFSLVLAQLNWALMHVIVAPALRSGTNPLVLSISREFLATLILSAYAWWTHGRARSGGGDGYGGEQREKGRGGGSGGGGEQRDRGRGGGGGCPGNTSHGGTNGGDGGLKPQPLNDNTQTLNYNAQTLNYNFQTLNYNTQTLNSNT